MIIHTVDAKVMADYSPPENSLLMRIFGQARHPRTEYPELLYPGKWANVLEYTFDDTTPHYVKQIPEDERKKVKLFDARDAEQIINDFNSWKDKIEQLVIHCWAGESRSPAVANALNNIFNLQCDLPSNTMFNGYIYYTMIETARKKGICSAA
jgi:hypothetical protein